MKFNDENKAVKEFNNDYFSFGIHEVQMQLFTVETNDNGNEYLEVGVVGKDSEEDSVRLYLTEKAANYTFNTMRQIFVHIAPEDKREEAGKLIDAVKDSDELIKLLNDKALGGKCWYTKYYDPKTTYVNKAGETKRSVNTNIYGYEPKPRPELMPDTGAPSVGGTPLDEPFPSGTPLTDSEKAEIPDNWAA